mmetsp:Transcript_15941/g.24651  ORF Transcript_15941/g.24651 Transcript_15941/m.24651 type:complete len:174 (-) Transcript_15941:2216-2737(-)
MENFIFDTRYVAQGDEDDDEENGQFQVRSLYQEKMFKLYDFNRVDDKFNNFRSNTIPRSKTIFDDMKDNKMQDEVLFTLEELFILFVTNSQKALLFEIVDPKIRESSMSVINPCLETVPRQKNIVEVKLQYVTFLQEKCILLTIGNVTNIVYSEHDKLRASYQEALTATVSHE